VSVLFFDKNGINVSYADSDSSGNYSSGGLPAGAYRVEFETPHYGDAGKYVGQFYSNKTSLALATPVNVTGTNQDTGINAILAKGGSISGEVVTLAKGRPWKTPRLIFTISTNTVVNYGWSDFTGSYQVAGLPAGNYRVHFYNTCPNNSEDYYNKKPSLAVADLVRGDGPQ